MPDIVLKESLRRGLRDTDENAKNSGSLVLLLNGKPTRNGIVTHPSPIPSQLLTAIAGAGITISHPFPQLFRGSNKTILLSENAAYEVNESTWGLSAISAYTLAGAPTTISAGGGAWEFVDVGPHWWAFNGVTTLVFATVGGYTQLYVDTTVPTQAGARFGGRLIFGGFNSSSFWASGHNTLHQYMTKFKVSPTTGLAPAGLGSNFIMWSSIGGGDELAMLYPTLLSAGSEAYSSGGHSLSRPIYTDFLERNECGFMPMEWKGTVLAIKPLGDKAIVYGDNGISVIFMANDPFPTIGQRTLRRFGLANRTSVGGDERGHVLIDTTGRVWRLLPDLSFQELDYSECIEPLTTNEISVTHDPHRDEFYITGTDELDDRHSYTITETGIYRNKHALTSAEFIGNSLVSVYESLPGTDHFILRTDTMDMDSRGLKAIKSIRVSGNWTGDLGVAIGITQNSGGWLAWSAYKTADQSGTVEFSAPSVELQVELYHEDYTAIGRIDSITITYDETAVRNFKATR